MLGLAWTLHSDNSLIHVSEFNGVSWSPTQNVRCRSNIYALSGDIDHGLLAVSYDNAIGPVTSHRWSVTRFDDKLSDDHLGSIIAWPDMIPPKDGHVYVNAFRHAGEVHFEHYNAYNMTIHKMGSDKIITNRLPASVHYVITYPVAGKLAYIGCADEVVHRDISYYVYKLANNDQLNADYDGGGVIESTIYAHFSIWDSIFARDIRMEEPFMISTGDIHIPFGNSTVLSNGIIIAASNDIDQSGRPPPGIRVIDLRAPTQVYMWPVPDGYGMPGHRVHRETIIY